MRILPRSAPWLAAVILVCGCFQTPFCQATDKSSSYLTALESIRAEQLKQHVDYLADDKLEGREAGRPGGRAAGDYLVRQLEELGLHGAGTDGGFLQPFGRSYRNVLAMLEGSDPELKDQVILVGGHYDHVGYGTRRNSNGPIGYIHNGADDNASGTSGLLELAEALIMLDQPPKRSILLAFWDAEEKGLLGSKHWTAHSTVPRENVVASISMDMIGRLRKDRLTVLGTRSGYGWRRLLSRQNNGPGLTLKFSWTLKAHSDHWPLFDHGIPVLLLHTGMHNAHHTPSDDVDLINHAGMKRVVRLLFALVHELAELPEVPGFRKAARHETEVVRKSWAAYRSKPTGRLGVAWRRRSSPGEGVRLMRVAAGSPAEKAGIEPGDRILQFAGREIHADDDLIGAVSAAENPASLLVARVDEAEPLELTVELDGKPMRLGIRWRVDDAEPGTIILTRVVPGSPAARAGLSPNDRIYQIAGRDFADDSQFVELAKTLPGPLELLVERNGKLRTVLLHVDVEPVKRAA